MLRGPGGVSGRVAVGTAITIVVLLVVGVLVWPSREESAEMATIDATTTTSVTVPPSSAPVATSGPAPTTLPTTTTTVPTTTAAPTTSTTPPSTTTTATPVPIAPPATTPPTTAAPLAAARGAGRSVDPFRGLGAWLDVLDWSPTYTAGRQRFRVTDVDVLADRGVQTLYIQTARYNRAEDVLDEALLRSIIDRAHGHDMAVVGWYLPTFGDPDRDLRRLVAIGRLGVDGVGVDIEDRSTVPDHAERNTRLLTLSRELREWLPDMPLAAIPIPPVVTTSINPAYWPGLPWKQLAAVYDVWMPMAYWTYRTPGSGWRDGYRYIAENIRLLRTLTGDPDLAVHPIGGEAAKLSKDELDGMVRAVADEDGIGGSIYDHTTTKAALYDVLRGLRRP